MPNRKLVDTHAHICDPVFDRDRAAVLAKAAAAGVGAVIAVGENMSDAHRNIELAAAHPMLRPAAGLYPTILDPVGAEQMRAFIKKERSNLCAIGEVGLDFWIVKEDADQEIQTDILVITDFGERVCIRHKVSDQSQIFESRIYI